MFRSRYFGVDNVCAEVQGLRPYQQHSSPGDQEAKPGAQALYGDLPGRGELNWNWGNKLEQYSRLPNVPSLGPGYPRFDRGLSLHNIPLFFGTRATRVYPPPPTLFGCSKPKEIGEGFVGHSGKEGSDPS